MPRSRVFDILQVYPFWVFDPGVFSGPQNAFPSVFDPALAFSSCTIPEITASFHEIKQIVSRHTRKVFKSVDVGTITLSRGVRWWDSDFYVWMNSAIRGERGVRKTLYLVHFLSRRVSSATDKNQPGVSTVPPENGFGALSNRAPARAWVLHGCLPGHYKAGGNFDAKSGEVSIAQLDIIPESVDEVTIGTLSQTTARAFSLGQGIASLFPDVDVFG